MESHYEVVCENEKDLTNKQHLKYVWRQIIICSGVWTLYFNAGLCVGAPTVFIPQIKQEYNSTESTNVVDEEMASWLYSSFGFSGIPWVIILPIFTKHVGRKLPYMISSASMLVVFIIFYFSNTLAQILTAEILQGFTHASNITITILIVTEYSDPKYRGIFLTIKSASFFWGVWVANAIGTFSHWKNIALVGMVSSTYTLINIFSPESPHWLMSKGKFEDGKRAYYWLHGKCEKTEKQLENLMNLHEEEIRLALEKTNKWSFDALRKMAVDRLFYAPLLLSVLSVVQYHFSGKIICLTFAIDIIKRMSNSESTAYTGMLILDGLTVLGMYVGTYLSKILKRRTLYLISSAIGVFFLLVTSLYMFLVNQSILKENNIVSMALLICYSVPISCGPMIMALSIYGELISRKYQEISYMIVAIVFAIFCTLLLKFSTALFVGLSMSGVFLFYGVTCGACTFLLYKYLPETKDKSMQEIEEYFKSPIHKDQGFNKTENNETVNI